MTSILVWEFASYLPAPLLWFLFRRFAARDISGDLICGAMIGAYVEFAAEPLWDYHFRFVIYKDVSLSVLLGWGVLFALARALSEGLHRRAAGVRSVDPFDRRTFLFDGLAGLALLVPIRLIGALSDAWDYNLDVLRWTWGRAPLLDIPFEALLSYLLLMTTAPVFLRSWGGGALPVGARASGGERSR